MDESCVMSAALVMYNLTMTFMYVSSTENLSHVSFHDGGLRELKNV